MLLQIPRSVVEERENLDRQRELPLAPFVSPSSFEVVAAGEELGPGVTEEVGDDDDEGSLNGNVGRFELNGQQLS